MFKFLTQRLQTKGIAVFVLLLTIPIAIQVAYNSLVTTSEVIEAAKGEELSNVGEQARAVENALRDIENEVLFLSDAPSVRAFVEATANGDSTINVDEELRRTAQVFLSFSNNLAIFDQVRLLDQTGREVVRVNYVNGEAVLVPPEELQDQSSRPYYTETMALPDDGIYISQLNLNRERGAIEQPFKPVIRYATPIYTSAGQPGGMVILNVLAENFLSLIESDDPNEQVSLLDADGTYLYSLDESLLHGRDLENGITYTTQNPSDAAYLASVSRDGLAFDGTTDHPDRFITFVRVSPPGQENAIQWTLVHDQALSNILQSVNAQRSSVILIGLGSLIVAVVVAVLFSGTIARPLQQLANVAEQIGQGQWTTPIPDVRTGDEIGRLAAAFRKMSAELQSSYGTLEHRVNERTRDLQIAADVSQQISGSLDLNALLQRVTDLTKERFQLYHSHIYLMDAEQRSLVLAAGAGEIGRQMTAEGRTIEYANPNSIAARAARSRRPVIENDVRRGQGFLPHRLLPNTRSEMAVPLVVGDLLVGVLDVQSDTIDGFKAEDEQVFSLMGGQIAVAIQNARSYTAVEEARAETTRIYDLSADLIGSAESGYFRVLNPAWEKLLGWSEEELRSRPFLEFVHPEDQQSTLDEYLRQLGEARPSIQFENRYMTKNGDYRWLSWNAVPQGDTTYFVTRDVTMTREADQRIRLYAEVMSNAPLGLYVWRLEHLDDPTSLRLSAANPASQAATGVAPENVIGKQIGAAFPGLLETEIPQIYARIARGGDPVDLGEITYGDEHIQPSIFSVTAFPLPNYSVGVSFENITERKRNEEAFRSISALQQAILSAADYGVISTTVDGIITSFNPAAERMLGYRAEEMVNKLTPAAFHDLDEVVTRAGEFSQDLGIQIAPGFEVFVAKARQNLPNEYEWTYIAKDGRRFPVLLSVTALRAADGEIIGFLGLAADITVRKQQEKELLARAREIETVALVGTEITTNLNADNLLWSIANITRESFGRYHVNIYLLDDAGDSLVLAAASGDVGQTLVERGHRIPLQLQRSLVARAAREGVPVRVNDVTTELDYLPNPLLMETRSELAVPIMAAHQLIGVLDIQDRVVSAFSNVEMQTKQVLANQIAVAIQNAKAFRSVEQARAETARIYTSSIDLLGSAGFDGYFKDLNPAWPATLGWSTEELLARPYVEFVHPDDVERTNREANEQLAAGFKTVSFVNRYLTKDGTYRWLSWNSTPDVNSSLIFFVARDVTRQRELEEERALYQSQLTETLQIAKIGYWEFEVATGLFTFNDEFYAIFATTGAEQGRYTMTAEQYAGTFVHPDDAPVVGQEVGNALSSADPDYLKVLNHRIVRADGSLGWIAVRVRVRLDDSGRVAFLYGANQDITELKQAEEDLRQQQAALIASEGRFRDIANTSPGAIYQFSASHDGWRMEYISPAIERISGVPADPIMMDINHLIQTFYPGDLEGFVTSVNAAVESLTPWNHEARLIHRDGRVIWWQGSSVPSRRADGAVVFTGILQDVTDRKLAQKQIEDLRLAMDQSAIVAITDVTGKITYVNDKFCEISKYTREELLGQDHRIINSNYHPKEFIRDLWVTIANGQVWKGELRNQAKDGTYYWVDTTIVPLLNTAGKPEEYIAIRYEITERKRQEQIIATRAREIETVVQVGAEITTNLDVDQLLWSLSSQVQQNFDRHYAQVYLLDRASGSLVLRAGAGEIGRLLVEKGHAIPLNREQSLVAQAAREKRPVVVQNTFIEPGYFPNPLLPQTRAEAAVPIMFGEEVLGVLDIQDNRDNAFSDDEIRAQLVLSNQIAIALQNARAFQQADELRVRAEILSGVTEALSRAQDEQQILDVISAVVERYGAMLSSLTYFHTDADNTVAFAELVAARSGEGHPIPLAFFPKTWLSREEFPTIDQIVANPNAFDAVTDRDNAPGMPETVRAFMEASGVSAYITIGLYTGEQWLGAASLSWAQPTQFEPELLELLKGVSPTLTSVVASRRVYLETQRARDEAQRLAALNAELSQAEDEEEILGVVSSIAEQYGVALSALVYMTSDANETVTAVDIVSARLGNGQAAPLSMFPTTHFAPSDMVTLQQLLDNPAQFQLLEDADQAGDASAREYLRATGVGAYLFIGLYIGQRWLAAITLNWAQPQRFDPQLLDILSAIHPTLTSVVASRRAFLDAQAAREQNARRARELETVARVSAASTSILDVEALLHSVAELTKEAFNLYHAHVYLYDAENQAMVLAAGAGEPGRLMKANRHRIPLSRQNSLVIQAALTRQSVVANDVTLNADFLPNPMLPNTHAELAIPMVVAGHLVGVLDIQSEEVNRFTLEDIRVQETLADQIAVAIENARSYSEASERAERAAQIAERLRDVDRLKSQFLANMSHELRTPLNSIIGYSEVLLDGVDGDLTEDAHEDVLAIHNSGRHLLSLINEILDLAKIEAGEMRLDIRPISLSEISQDVLRTSQVLVKDKPVELLLHVEENLPRVAGDAIRVRQIILNLVSNACKFTERGSVSVILERVDMNNVRLAVRDTGIGIPEDKLPRVFERFSQVDGSSTRRAGGTGLGLTITQQLVQMHGGEIIAESVYGEGSVFHFLLPVHQSELESIQ